MDSNEKENIISLSACSANDILSTLLDSGIIDAAGVLHVMKQKQEDFILRHHRHKRWQGKDGRWRTFLPDPAKPKGRRLISRSSKDELDEVLYNYYSNVEEQLQLLEEQLKRSRVSLEDLFEEWIQEKAKHYSASTIARNKCTWKSLYKSEQIIKTPICDLTTKTISDWIEEKVVLKRMNQHQYNSFTSVIRQMFEYAEERRIISVNPVASIKIRKRVLRPEPKKRSESQVFTPEERDKLVKYSLDQYKAGRNKVQRFVPLAIAFLLSVSLRRGEVTALEFGDLNGIKLTLARSFSHGAQMIEERLKDADGWREVFVPPSALDIIELVRSERLRLGMPVDECIFVVNEKHQSFYSSLGKMINKYCNELNIPKRSLHSTRRTCASIMHAANVSDLTIQSQLGHKDLRTTHNSYLYNLTNENELYDQISKALK